MSDVGSLLGLPVPGVGLPVSVVGFIVGLLHFLSAWCLLSFSGILVSSVS